MQFSLEDVKKSLNEYKDVFIGKLKESENITAEKIAQVSKDLDAKIAKQEEEWEKRKLSLPGLDEELKKKQFFLSKVVQAQLNPKGWDGVPESAFEKEVCDKTMEIAQRSNNAGTGAAGGYLIPDEVSSTIIDLAMATTPVMELGPTLLKGLRGELPIPKITGRPTMYWVGEEEAASESETTFGEVVLRPKTAAAFTKVSRRLLYQTVNVAEQIIRDQLVKSFRLGIDQALIEGTGTEKQIKGVQNFAGLTATAALGTNGGRFTIDKAAEMQMNLDVANMLKGNLGYLMRPEVLSFMLRERVLNYSTQDESRGQPIGGPQSVLMSKMQLEEILGYKVRTSTLISKYTKGSSTLAASRVFFGDWSQLLVGMWEGFEIKASDVAGNAGGSALTQRQIWITAFQGIDSNMADETGMTMLEDALTNATYFGT